MAFLSLRDYGVIGNQSSAALVSRLGAIDWCCLPYLDSASHFGALLDENQGGSFQICPIGEFKSEQRYVARTNVLETDFETPRGRATLVDWMPIDETGMLREPVIHRQIRAIEGSIRLKLSCQPRFGYGAESAEAEAVREGILFRSHSATELAVLRSSVPTRLSPDRSAAIGDFTLNKGDHARFTWVWGRHGRLRDFPSPEATIKAWRALAHRCEEDRACLFAGPWHDVVVRSSLALKLLTSHFSGAIAEAATTSLPSLSGGSRNWDYRYAWIRDSALAVQALTALGHREEAQAFFGWLADVVERDGAEGLQAVYALDGGKHLPERELPFLSGYAGSRPVRVGNLSSRQFQLDIYGHVLLAAAQFHRTFRRLPEGLWPRLSAIADYVCQAWRRPDRGPWEVRTKPEHFVASKVLCWVALDRAIWLAGELGIEVPRRWTEERAILHRTVCEQGYDTNRRSFVRAFGGRELDASALLVPLMGFLPFDDERVRSTLDAIRQELSEGVLIYRSRSAEGLPESDGAHLLSSFWFVSCLALAGHVDEAVDRLAELCTYASPLGLFAEQVDPAAGEPAGNFPSAGSHLALVNASLMIAQARGRRLEPGLVALPRAA